MMTQECIRCKNDLTLDKFKVKRGNTRLKGCIDCNLKKVENTDKNKCEHNRQRITCKECGGGSICEHNRRRSQCKECGGSSICEHNRMRCTCKECGGASICEHGRRKSRCKECGGASICEHNRQRITCKECGGGSICEHGRRKSRCKECGGASICEHNRQRSRCKECDFGGYLKSLVSSRVRWALKEDKELYSEEYLGCDIDTFKKHIEDKFEEGMNWDNLGSGEEKWNIDHITPVEFNNPTMEEKIERLHYLNTQPLWAVENLAKGNRYCG